MDRRSFLFNGLGTTGAIALLTADAVTSVAFAAQEEFGIGRHIAIASRIYGTPRWDGSARVPGTLFIIAASLPQSHPAYYLSVASQYKRGDDPWDMVPPVSDYRGSKYKSGAHGGVRDFVYSNQKGITATLFIPDEVHFLKEGPVSIRYTAKVFDNNNNELDEYEVPLQETRVTVRKRQGRRIFEYGYKGVEIVRVYDKVEKRFLLIGESDGD